MTSEGATHGAFRADRATRKLWLPVLCAVVSSTAACSQTPDIALPAEWANSMTGEQSAVLFRPDGTGTFTEFPLWNGAECTSDEATPYSGEFRWRAVDGYFQVDAPNGPMNFQPDAQMFSDNWGEIVVSICGADTPDDEVLIYGADFPRS